MQDLANGHLDVKALGEAANGDENTIVTTRTGNTYPSAERAINIMFQNGGLPATPFATKALMTASALVDGKYAQVTDDTVNNGLYVKTAGAWVKSNYDPLTQAKTYTDSSITTALNKSSGTFDTLALLTASTLIDGSFALVANDTDLTKNGHYKKTAGSWIKVAYDPAALALSEANKTLVSKGELKNYVENVNAKPLFALITPNEEELARIDDNLDWFLPKMDKSIQQSIKDIDAVIENGGGGGSGGVVTTHTYTKEFKQHSGVYTLPSEFINRLTPATIINKHISPVPLYMAPQNFAIGGEWTKTLKFANDAGLVKDRIPIAGYDPTFRDDIGVVHPQTWTFTEKVAGYRHWMGINPYTANNEDIELAYIYGTNDPEFKDWTLIQGFPVPFEEDPDIDESTGQYRGFMSDSGFTYDVDTGDLVFYWRKYLYFRDALGVETETVGIRARRFDGLAWSEIFDLVPPEVPWTNNSNYRSISIVYNPNDNLYYAYVTSYGDEVYYHTTPKLNGKKWSNALPCTIVGNGAAMWHIDVKPIGDKLVIIGHVKGNTGILQFGYSDDFTTFHLTNNSLVDNIASVYKCGLIPVINEDLTGYINVFYTINSGDRSLYVTKTTPINFGV